MLFSCFSDTQEMYWLPYNVYHRACMKQEQEMSICMMCLRKDNFTVKLITKSHFWAKQLLLINRASIWLEEMNLNRLGYSMLLIKVWLERWIWIKKEQTFLLLTMIRREISLFLEIFMEYIFLLKNVRSTPFCLINGQI